MPPCLYASVPLCLRASVHLCVSVYLSVRASVPLRPCASVPLSLSVSPSVSLCIAASQSPCLCALMFLRLCVSVSPSLSFCASVSLCLCLCSSVISVSYYQYLCASKHSCLYVSVSLCPDIHREAEQQSHGDTEAQRLNDRDTPRDRGTGGAEALRQKD